MEHLNEAEEHISTMTDERLLELYAHYNNTLLDLNREMWRRGLS